MQPSLLLPLLRPPAAAELSAAAVGAVTQLLLQPAPVQLSGNGETDGISSNSTSDQPYVRVSLTAGGSDGPVSLTLQPISPGASAAASVPAEPDADAMKTTHHVRQLPADMLEALLAALERPDAPGVRAAAAAALRSVVAAAAAAHVSDLRPSDLQPQGADADTAPPLDVDSPAAAAEAGSGPVTVRLEVLGSDGSSGSASAHVKLTLSTHDSAGQKSGAAAAAVYIDLQPSQLADIAAAAAQAASDVDPTAAAAAAALLADVAAPTALAASDAVLRPRLQEPVWRVQACESEWRMYGPMQ